MTQQLELPFPTTYHLGIYESVLSWRGTNVPITIIESGQDIMRVRLERDYAPLTKAGMEIEVHSTGFQRTLGMSLTDTLTDENRWTSSLWTPEGQFLGYGILGTKEKLKGAIKRTS
ncbi:hypothetical protein HYT55_04725 [Candidatus Woesearchaeota archaeon]|nr:hypothetical protein [Candidatus Woesearchaeota archaeon]